MKLARKAGETHPFFDDIALKESTHWYISTSQLSCEHFEGYGWGEVGEVMMDHVGASSHRANVGDLGGSTGAWSESGRSSRTGLASPT